MSDGSGAATLVLHTHLPWVLHHGRWPHGVDWLSEAVAESYLPLLDVLETRAARGASLGLTLAVSPVLCDALVDPAFAGEFRAWAEARATAAARDAPRLAAAGATRESAVARRWERFYREAIDAFFGRESIVARLRRLEARGAIEVAGCAATHAYLPLLGTPGAVARQVEVALERHRRHFGRAPRGLWLPECAYRPAGRWQSALDPDDMESWREGIEEVLEGFGIGHCFVERHLIEGHPPIAGAARASSSGILASRTAPRHARGAARPVTTSPRANRAYRIAGSSVVVFGRDGATSETVWSRECGYPGDPAYLEFHRQSDPGGLRYWAVTGDGVALEDKAPYQPEAAAARVRAHAIHFLDQVATTLAAAGPGVGRPHLCAMFDTELFGHWWFEGPAFLAEVLDRAAERGVRFESAAAHAEAARAGAPRLALAEGSWGAGGDHRTWLHPDTLPIWRRVHAAERAFEAVARRAWTRREPVIERVLRQAAREVMLLEASDWPFLVTHRAARDYAEARVAGHAAAAMQLTALAASLLDGPLADGSSAAALLTRDRERLAALEASDGCFPDLDWRAGLAPVRARPAAPVPAGI